MEDFWYGMEENCQYGIWKNRLPFHTMPCFSNVADAFMFIYFIPIPDLQCVYATQLFPRDDARKNSAETHWSRHAQIFGTEVRDKKRVKKQFTVEVKNRTL